MRNLRTLAGDAHGFGVDARCLAGLRSGAGDLAMEQITERMTERTELTIAEKVSRVEPTLVIITSLLVGLILLAGVHLLGTGRNEKKHTDGKLAAVCAGMVIVSILCALSPADVISVTQLVGQKACRVVVPDDQLSLAIGKEGQNARLAARLTGCKIDIKPASQAEEAVEE